jgi:hypothetical protein
MLYIVIMGLMLSLVSTYKYWLEPGYIFLTEEFEVFTPAQFLKVAFPLWNENIQAYSFIDVMKLYYYLILYIIGVLFGYKSLQGIALTFPIFNSFLSSYILIKYLVSKTGIGIKNRLEENCFLAIITGAIVYTYNPWFAIQSRNIILRLEYSFLPLLMYYLVKYLDTGLYRYLIYKAFILGLFFEIRTLIIYSIYSIISILIYFLLENKGIMHNIRKIIIYFTMYIFLLIIALPRLLPAVIQQFTTPSSVEAFNLQMVRREPIYNIFTLKIYTYIGSTFDLTYSDNSHYMFLLITIYSFLYLILTTKKSYRYIFPPAMFIFGILLASKEINLDLLINSNPFLSRLFRDSYWNVLLMPLSVSIMVSYTTYDIFSIISRKLSRLVSRKLLHISITVFILALTFISAWPFLTGSMNGYWRPTPIPHDHIELFGVLNKISLNEYTHILWIPSFGDPRTIWVKQTGPFTESAPSGIIEIRSSPMPSIVWSNYYFFRLYNVVNGTFALSPFELYDKYYLPIVYSLVNIKYIGISYDRLWPTPFVLGGLNNERLKRIVDDLSNVQGYELIYKGQYLAVLKLVNNASQVMIREPIICICKLDYIGQLAKLNISDYLLPGLIYPRHNLNITNYLDKGVPIIANDYESLLATLAISMQKTIVIVPFKYIYTYDPDQTWSRAKPNDFLFLYDLYKNNIRWSWDYDYDYGMVYTWGINANLALEFSIDTSGDYLIFIRALASPHGGYLDIYIDDNYVGYISTNKSVTQMEYFKIDPIHLYRGQHKITIVNKNGLNVINIIAVTPISIYNSVKQYISAKSDRIHIIPDKISIYRFDNISNRFVFTPIIDYVRLPLSAWKVKVRIEEPSLLVFAEAYDPLWEAKIYQNGLLINATRSIPVYDLVNGFYIDTIGDIDIIIEYLPQYYFNLSVYIMLAILFITTLIYYIQNIRLRKSWISSIYGAKS